MLNKCRKCFSTFRSPEYVFVEKPQVEQFIIRCMKTVGADDKHAAQLAEVLAAGDYRGHYSHGLNRLEMYVRDLKTGICRGNGEPSVLKETAATAWINGNNLLGPVVGNFCMDLAIHKAKDAGIGMVVAKGSGIHKHITNYGAYERKTCPLLGTNPLSFAAPALNDDSFVLDMATTAVAVGKVEMESRKGRKIPEGWAVDSEGKDTVDPNAALAAGGLHPLGGTELTSGFKGYGLSLMVEVLCGILAAASFGPNVRRWMSTETIANLGQCFVAIDPSMFAPGFKERLQSLLDICRNEPSIGGQDLSVLVAGDPERRHMAICDKNGGIPYHKNVVDHMQALAKELAVPPLKTK